MSRQITRREAVVIGGSVVVAGSVAPGLLAGPVAGRSRKLLYFTKSSGYQHSVVTRPDGAPAFSERLLVDVAREHDIEVTASKDGGVFDKDFENYDGFMFYTTGDLTRSGTDNQPPMSARGKQNLLDAINGGKGFAGSHCASDTFHTQGKAFENQDVKDPYIDMIGGEFIRHGAQQVATMTVADAGFPGMKDAGRSFSMREEWYSLKNFAKDLHVLLVNETKGMVNSDYQRPPYPATWARNHGEGRVFYTSMGHREDVWTHPLFQLILMGGLMWSLKMVDADVSPNIDRVTPQAHVMPPER